MSPCRRLHQCRLCGAQLTRTFVDLGMSPLCESYVPAEQLDEAESLLSAARPPVRGLPARAASRLRARRGHLLRLRLLLLVLRLVGGAREALRRGDDRAARPDPGQPRHRGGQQRRLPAAALPGGGHPGARRRAGRRTWPRPPGPGASGPRSSSSAPRPAARSRAQYGRADLVAANNVFAHVPDIRGFAAGLRALVKDDGMVTLEFPHLLRLIERRQYDTIYHEHFSYLSLLTALAGAGDGRAARGRRRGAGHARRLAAGLRPARRERPASRPSG